MKIAQSYKGRKITLQLPLQGKILCPRSHVIIIPGIFHSHEESWCIPEVWSATLSQLSHQTVSAQTSARPARSQLSQWAAPLRCICQASLLSVQATSAQLSLLSTNQNKQIVFSKPAEKLSDTSFALPSDSGINFLLKTIDSLNGLVLVHFCQKARFWL